MKTALPTNNHKPFIAGELITFCGEVYTVAENNGSSGSVYDSRGNLLRCFRWSFEGEECVRFESNHSPILR